MCDELAAISGREKHKPHWEQLLQRMAEIHVIRQAVGEAVSGTVSCHTFGGNGVGRALVRTYIVRHEGTHRAILMAMFGGVGDGLEILHFD
jgi:hypothetical protein